MTVTNVHKDPDALTMTITVELDASVERAWQLWADPRQLERWWGPPTYPATFVDHDLTPGSRATYYMTTPEGEKPHGWWEVLAVDPPRRLEVKDGFADDTAKRRPACGQDGRDAGRARRQDRDGDHVALPVARGDGAGAGDGSGRRDGPGDRPDRRDPRRRRDVVGREWWG